MKVSIAFAVAAACVAATVASQAPKSAQSLHQTSFASWFSKHPDYRAARPEDCQCNDDIESIRRGDGGAFPAVPNYQPYFIQGDFNGDGVGDAAIVAISAKADPKIVIVVSVADRNAGKAATQQIPRTGENLVARALFCARPYPATPEQSCRLLFGAFESEAEVVPIKKPSKRS